MTGRDGENKAVKASLGRQGAFYIGGKRQRMREVLIAHEIWVDWRDVDPETVDFVSWLGAQKGQCAPRPSLPGRNVNHRARREVIRGR